MSRKLDIWTIYRVPLLLGLFSMAGLFAALIGDHAWDWTSWALLGAPVAIGGYYLARRPTRV